MSILSNRAPQVTPGLIFDWITPGYENRIRVVSSLPPTGTNKEVILVGSIATGGKYYQYDSSPGVSGGLIWDRLPASSLG